MTIKPKPEGYVFGRPTEYRPEMCEIAFNVLAGEEPLIAVAAEIGIAKSTMQQWIELYPDFSAAIQRGLAVGERGYTKEGKQNLENNKYNTKMYELLGMNIYNWKKNTHNETKITLSQEDALKDLD